MRKKDDRPAALLGRLVAVVGLGVLWLMAPIRLAVAHANLVRAEPPPGSVLPESPERVRIWFTEPIEPGFSSVQVLDTLGRPVDNGDSAVDPLDPTILSVTFPPLPPGTYTVAWANLSSVDGHRVQSSFVFSVGEAIAGAPDGPAATAQPILENPLEPVLRWLALVAILGVVGGLSFEWWVLAPVVAREDSPTAVQVLGPRLAGRLGRGVWLAMGLFLLTSLGLLLFQGGLVQEAGLSGLAVRPLLQFVVATNWGRLWLVRIGLSLLLVVGLRFFLALRGRPAAPRRPAGTLVAIGLGSGILLTASLTSHAAATETVRLVATLSDFLHLLAAAFWVGGLFHFALIIPLVLQLLGGAERRHFLAAMVPRFSVLAALSVGTLFITGLYSAFAQVTVWPALQTPYGLALLVKLALIVPLLLLGAFNLLWLSRRLALEERAGRLLRRSVTAEATLGALVLLAVGFLVTLEPARQVASREGVGTARSLSFEDTAEGAHIFLDVVPGQVGANQIQVRLQDRHSDPITNVSDLALTAIYLDAGLPPLIGHVGHAGEGEYAFHDLNLSLAGRWRVELDIFRPDAFDAHAAFDFVIPPPAGTGSAVIAPDRATGLLLGGLELVLLGLLFLGVSIPLGGWRQRRGRPLTAIGAVGVASGLLLLGGIGLDVFQIAADPIPASPASIASGQTLYQQHCLSCHGPTGQGDGPVGLMLIPRPADLSLHAIPGVHSDEQLYEWITNGLPGSVMPAFEMTLTDEERWHLVNFIRTLAPPQ